MNGPITTLDLPRFNGQNTVDSHFMGAHSRRGIRQDRAGMILITALIAVCVTAVVGVIIAAPTRPLELPLSPSLVGELVKSRRGGGLGSEDG